MDSSKFTQIYDDYLPGFVVESLCKLTNMSQSQVNDVEIHQQRLSMWALRVGQSPYMMTLHRRQQHPDMFLLNCFPKSNDPASAFLDPTFNKKNIQNNVEEAPFKILHFHGSFQFKSGVARKSIRSGFKNVSDGKSIKFGCSAKCDKNE